MVDDATRECLSMEVDTSLSGHRATRVLDRIASTRQLPQRIVLGNGPEFTSRALDLGAYHHEVELRFIRPGTPISRTPSSRVPTAGSGMSASTSTGF